MFGLDPDGLTLGVGIPTALPPQFDRWRVLSAGPEGASVAALIDGLRADGMRVGP